MQERQSSQLNNDADKPPGSGRNQNNLKKKCMLGFFRVDKLDKRREIAIHNVSDKFLLYL
jgi:hypothetical protein